MKKIRILNDIDVAVSVYRDGAAEDFTGKTVVLTLATSIAKMSVTDFSVEGNVVSFRFAAGQQKFTGVYRLTIQVADGEGNVNTVDKCEVFQLVKCSCEVDGEDDVNISTTSVELSADLAVESGGGSGGGTSDYGALNNKPSINGITLTGDKTAKELGLAEPGDYVSSEQYQNDMLGKQNVADGELAEITGSEKVAVDNGGLSPVTVTLEQVRDYAVAEVTETVDRMIYGSDDFGAGGWTTGDLSAVAAASQGDATPGLDWEFYLLDTTDNAGETTTPVGKLARNNLLRYEDGTFAPAVGITEGMRAACDVALYDGSGNLVYAAGAYDAEAEWETDKALIVAGGYLESAARKLYTDAEATTEVSHKLRPWETVETKYTIGKALPYKVWLLDNSKGYSGKTWRGLFKKAVIWDGVDVSPYPLAPTAISPCPSCTVGGKTRNFFYLYEGEANCKSADGEGSLCTMFSNGRTYPRVNDISQMANMNYARANNADDTLPYPFAEGGYHALNTFIISQEVLYGTKYLHDPSMFGSGISANNNCNSEATWKLYGGVRYKLSSGDTWKYCNWNASTDIYRTAAGARSNMSATVNYEYPKEQCMESQMALSYAVETGVAAGTEFEMYGGTYWYENVDGALGVADGYMNARVYKKMSQTFGGYDSTGAEVSWDVEVILRMSLIEGMNISGDIYAYWGGGYEQVGTCRYLQSVQRTGNDIELYLQPDQTKWTNETNVQKTNLGVFDFEDSYIKVGEYKNLSNSWVKTRAAYTAWKTESGGSVSTGECCYIDDANYWGNVLNQRMRISVRVRGYAYFTACSGRILHAYHGASTTTRIVGGSAQALIKV